MIASWSAFLVDNAFVHVCFCVGLLTVCFVRTYPSTFPSLNVQHYPRRPLFGDIFEMPALRP